MIDKKCIIIVLVMSIAGLGWSHPLARSYSKHCKKSYGRFPKEGSLCRSYYECQRWSAKERKCSGNDHFHPAKERCVRPEEFPCLEKPPASDKCPRKNGKFLKPGTKCRKYYDCCDGRPTKRECPGDTLFDPDRETCEYPELYHCVEDGNKEFKKCPKKDGKFLKVGSGCRAYYDCRRGRAREKSCPRGQLFDRKRRKCDRGHRVTCADDSEVTTAKPHRTTAGDSSDSSDDSGSDSSDESDSSSDSSDSSDESDSSEELTSEPPTVSEYSSLKPSKSTTTREFFTDESSTTHHPSTVTSTDQETTDSVGIKSSTTSAQTDSETSSETPTSRQSSTEYSVPPSTQASQMTESTTVQDRDGSTSASSQSPFTTEVVSNIFTHERSTTDAASSTQSSSELFTDVKEVTNGNSFEASTSTTDEVVSDFSTSERSTTEGISSTSSTETSIDETTDAEVVIDEESIKCPKQDGKFPKKGSGCKTYYDCRRGRANEKSCPSGQLFDRTREKCDWEELVPCIDDSDLNSKCLKPDDKYVKRGSKCRAYYDCQDGVATEKDCPEDQLFSVGRQRCDWEELVTCEDDGITTARPYRTTAGDSSEEETSEPTTASEHSSTPSNYTTGGTREIFTDESSSSHHRSTFASTLSSQWTVSSDQPSTDSVEFISTTASDQTASETSSGTPSSYQPTTESSTFLPTQPTRMTELTEQSTTDLNEGTPSPTSASTTHIPSELSTDVKEVTDGYTFETSSSTTAEVVSDISTRESSKTDDVQQPSTSLTQSSSDDYTGTSKEISTRIDLTSTLPTEGPRTTVPETSKDLKEKDGFETSTLDLVSLPSTSSVKTTETISDSSTVYSTFDYTLSSSWITEQPGSTTESSSTSEDDGYTLSTSVSSISDKTNGLLSTWPPTVPTTASEDDGLGFSTSTRSTSDETSQSVTPTEIPTTSDESTASTSRHTLTTGTEYPTSKSEDDSYTLSTSASSISDGTNGLSSTWLPTVPTTASEDDGLGFSTSTRPSSDETSQSLSPTEIPTTSDESTASSIRHTLSTGTEYPTSESEDEVSSPIPTDRWTAKTTNTPPPKTSTSKKVTNPGTGDLYCPEPDGHFPHPTNRHKFIACVGGRLFEMDCPADLVFVLELMRCEYDNQ